MDGRARAGRRLARPLGGWLSDKLGGARVTLYNFAAMAGGVFAVLCFLNLHSFAGFFVAFVALFAATGVGNGSTYRMIPVIFRTERERAAESAEELPGARETGLKEGSFVLGFVGAIGAYGGFLIPQSYNYSIQATGGPQLALWLFVAYYASCIAATWYFYGRRGAKMPC